MVTNVGFEQQLRDTDKTAVLYSKPPFPALYHKRRGDFLLGSRWVEQNQHAPRISTVYKKNLSSGQVPTNLGVDRDLGLEAEHLRDTRCTALWSARVSRKAVYKGYRPPLAHSKRKDPGWNCTLSTEKCGRSGSSCWGRRKMVATAVPN
jgi:hypothetical protein